MALTKEMIFYGQVFFFLLHISIYN